MQMQRMEMRMKLPLKHDTRYAQEFVGTHSGSVKHQRRSFLQKHLMT